MPQFTNDPLLYSVQHSFTDDILDFDSNNKTLNQITATELNKQTANK